MANKQTECLNERCSSQLKEDTLWCSLDCKRMFLLGNYSDGQVNRWFKEAGRDFNERQKRVLKEIKDSGLSFSKFLESLGNKTEESE